MSKHVLISVCTIAFASASVSTAPADTIRVPADQPTIQAGIDAAIDGDVVLIADGVYTGTGNKNLDFAGKAITVRSENGRDKCIIDCEDDGRGFYFHSGEGADSGVQGLTIRNGLVLVSDPVGPDGGGILCLSSSPMIIDCSIFACGAIGNGGGLYCDNGSPVIRGCIFDECLAFSEGGGVELRNSNATVQNCSFEDCSAITGSGMAIIGGSPLVQDCAFIRNRGSDAGAGSAIYCFAELTPPQIIACYFDGNTATTALCVAGSAVVVRGCFFTGHNIDYTPAIADYSTDGAWIESCRFTANRTLYGPGAVQCASRTVLLNCQFYDNASGLWAGGAITVRDGTTVRNCTFAGNFTCSGGGGAVHASGSASSFQNCVFWNNDPVPITFRNESPVITYSLVEGGWTGEGNIDLDPRFVDQANGDLHLLGDSPAIDAGDPASVAMPGETDIDGQARVWNGRIDMGSDEFGSFVFGDLNCDERFDAFDIEPFLLALFDPDEYQEHYPDCDINLGDINGDGSVNTFDIEPFVDLLFP